MEDRIKAAESRMFKVVFPPITNHYDTLFGGMVMQIMDEAAFITATRYSRLRMVTVSSEKIDFKKAIPGGVMIEAVASVFHVGNTSMKVKVEIFMEEMYSTKRESAVEGMFTFVAVDEHHKPVAIE
ncbi:MAG: acyl-CoA thioesterase [Cytophagaceae bacterium]|jgi:acyl-CoA hydrolase|nr:acyl-CoA thioesterase [Cytophagaceae bacterium]